MFYMPGSENLLRNYEYSILGGGSEELVSGIIPGFTIGNAKALIKIRHSDLMKQFDIGSLEIKLKKIVNNNQLSFPFITRRWEGI